MYNTVELAFRKFLSVRTKDLSEKIGNIHLLDSGIDKRAVLYLNLKIDGFTVHIGSIQDGVQL
jgi:hypothetical protein